MCASRLDADTYLLAVLEHHNISLLPGVGRNHLPKQPIIYAIEQ
jgi:hypothetical protein|eukprot:COSAG06_NODE_2458_length_6841_cov_31.691041_4_plen_44_part_00